MPATPRRNALGATGGPADFSGGMLERPGLVRPVAARDPAEAGLAAWSPPAVQQWLKTGRNRSVAPRWAR